VSEIKKLGGASAQARQATSDWPERPSHLTAVGIKPNKVMLDPSLFLHRSTLDRTVTRIPDIRKSTHVEFVISAGVTVPFSDIGERGRYFFRTGRELVNPTYAADLLAEVGVKMWSRPDGAVRDYEEFRARIGKGLESRWLQDVLFDEWYFLTHESWLVSRLKAPFRAMVRAGELGVEVLNPIVRRTLKDKAPDVIKTADRLRALGKWMAVGGPSAAAFVNPIAAALVSPVAGGFLLLDPPE
jgi:hypothetical protein